MPVDPAAEAPLVAQVWRSINDPFVGQLTMARVWGGTLKADSEVFNAAKEQKERVGTVYFLNGKKQETVPEAQAGDIVALAKLKVTGLNDTLVRGGQAGDDGADRLPEPGGVVRGDAQEPGRRRQAGPGPAPRGRRRSDDPRAAQRRDARTDHHGHRRHADRRGDGAHEDAQQGGSAAAARRRWPTRRP